MKTFATIVGVAILMVGCATTDLLTDQNKLTTKDRTIAMRMQDKAYKFCYKVQYDPSTNVQLPGSVKFGNKPSVLKLYSSNTDWWRADLVVNSVWDSVYLHEFSGQFVCGEKNWEKMPVSRYFSFEEVKYLK